MFERTAVRGWLAVGWLALFAGMWLLFQYLLPEKTMLSELDRLERSVAVEEWGQAARSMDSFDRTWRDNKLLIQINNGSVDVSDFERELVRIRTLVTHREDDALELIGGLRAMTKTITTVFPGP